MLLTTLTEQEILQVHHASLRVLSETGILIDDLQGRSLLFDQGAWESKGRLCLLPDLVEACLAKCPSTVTLRSRAGGYTTHPSGQLPDDRSSEWRS